MLGLALSGGGHRATVFGMGALLAQADPECDRVLSISSVAGKSVANGLRNLQRAVAKRIPAARSGEGAGVSVTREPRATEEPGRNGRRTGAG